jgi:flagellar hook-length control protein FliK
MRGHIVVASSATAIGSASVSAAQSSTQARAGQRTRTDGLSSAFSEALDQQQRALGEAERDSRASGRSRNQRRQAAEAGTLDATVDAASSQTVPPAGKAEAADKPIAPAEGTEQRAASNAIESKAPGTDPQAAPTDQSPQICNTASIPPETPSIASAVTTPVVTDTATATADEDTALAITAVATGTAATATEEAPVLAVAAGIAANAKTSAETAAAANAQVATAETAGAGIETVAKSTENAASALASATVTTSATAGQTPPEGAKDTTAKVEAKAGIKLEAQQQEARPEPNAQAQPASNVQASATDAASAQASATASTSSQPSQGGPLSFAAEVAQKVAAQTTAAGSVVPVHALAVTIAARANAGSTRFDIRLDPPELGRIDVQLTLDKEGRVKSKLVVEKQETLDLLQRDQRNLERTLSQAGLNTTENGIEFSLQDQSGQGSRDRQEETAPRRWQAVIEDPDAQATLQANAATYSRLAAARGGIDIRI